MSRRRKSAYVPIAPPYCSCLFLSAPYLNVPARAAHTPIQPPQEGEGLAYELYAVIESLCSKRNCREKITRGGREISIGTLARDVVPIMGSYFSLRTDLRELHAELIMTEYAKDEKVDDELREMLQREEAKAHEELQKKLGKMRANMAKKMEKNKEKVTKARSRWQGRRPTSGKYNRDL